MVVLFAVTYWAWVALIAVAVLVLATLLARRA
jgi:general stress protein CsbA